MQCSRSGCPFLRHPNPANNGGTHCCAACKRTGGHGPMCRQISLEENRRRKKKKKGKATTTTTTTTTTTMVPMFKSSQYPNRRNQTFNIPANKTVTVTLFCQSINFFNYSSGRRQTSPGSAIQFSFKYNIPGTITLNNALLTIDSNGFCTATMSYANSTGIYSAIVNTEQYKWPSPGYTTISGNVASGVTTIWNTPPTTQYYTNIVNNLNTAADELDPVGYWEFAYN